MATHSSILVWRIPWTEKPGGLESMGSQELDMTNTLLLLFFFNKFICLEEISNLLTKLLFLKQIWVFD